MLLYYSKSRWIKHASSHQSARYAKGRVTELGSERVSLILNVDMNCKQCMRSFTFPESSWRRSQRRRVITPPRRGLFSCRGATRCGSLLSNADSAPFHFLTSCPSRSDAEELHHHHRRLQQLVSVPLLRTTNLSLLRQMSVR